VYDFIYERAVTGPRRWVHSCQKFSAIRSASTIICISNATRDDLGIYVGEDPEQDVRVIHLAAGEEFRPIDIESSERPFILFVGRRGGYKNFEMVLQALAFLPDFELICVGGGTLRAEELANVDNSVRERVRQVGALSSVRLNELYNRATCLAYPSSYEGFGIPALEAMQAGCPVVSTKCKAVLEIGGDALTVAESDPVDLARCILQVTSASYRTMKIQAGLLIAGKYSWEDTYQRTLEVYRGAI
jgi:mannosyltransferase